MDRILLRGVRVALRASPAGRGAGRHLSLAGVRKTLRLSRVADEHPQDGRAQAAFLADLNGIAPRAVLRRVEAGQHAVNDGVRKEYIKALSKTGQLHTVNIADVMGGGGGGGRAAEEGAKQQGQAPPEKLHFTAGISPERPLQLQMPKPLLREELWLTIRALGVTFVIMTGLTYIVELFYAGPGKVGAADQEYHPSEDASGKRFSDVKGCGEAVEELRDVVSYLRDPSIYTHLGGKLPAGILLTGPPGTGKTLLARAVAGEAGVPFFYASGSEFEEVFVGVGAKRIRSLFAAAKEHAPCIVFIDEIDAVGGKRNPRDTQSSKMTLNQLLVEMDGFDNNQGVVVIGATNFPGLLDTALTRPGRFDQEVPVQLPDVRGREAILELYLRAKQVIGSQLDSMINLLARGTPGFTGAELENLVNMASIRATVRGADAVELGDLEFAREKILMGPEKKKYRMTEDGRRCTAHHEAGHAMVAALTNGARPIYKATILPRGQALGMVQQLPDGDEHSLSRQQAMAHIDVCMGGRVAEELLLGKDDYTSGAVSDYQQATNTARDMVMTWGMSDRIGPVSLDDDAISPHTRKVVDEEVARILDESHSRVKTLIVSMRGRHLAVADALLDRDTLTGAEIESLIKGKPGKVTQGRELGAAAPSGSVAVLKEPPRGQ